MSKLKRLLMVMASLCMAVSLFPATAFAGGTPAGVNDVLAAPQNVKLFAYSVNSATLSWDDDASADGYEVYWAKPDTEGFTWFSWLKSTPFCTCDINQLVPEQTYYLKIRAYKVTGGERIYSGFSETLSVTPGYAVYYQGDSRWGFSGSVASRACLMTAYAITIQNMGISATPRTVYNSNGKRTSMNMDKLQQNIGVKAVCALPADSMYLSGFDGQSTYIDDPSANAVAAIKEALDLHPEGVILYFKKGSRAHAVVACKYDGDTIWFSDPGRDRDTLVTFDETWVSCHHHMTYANLKEMIALDPA